MKPGNGQKLSRDVALATKKNVIVVSLSDEETGKTDNKKSSRKFVKSGASMGQLCLIQSRAERAMRNLIAKQLLGYRLTMMQWLALTVIDSGDKRGLSMSRIAFELDVTLPQVTALAATLLEQKLIRQKILASDRRGRQVTTTIKGKRILIKLEDSIALALSQWSHGVSDERMQEYIKITEQLSQNAS